MEQYEAKAWLGHTYEELSPEQFDEFMRVARMESVTEDELITALEEVLSN